MGSVQLAMPDARVTYVPALFSRAEGDRLFARLRDEVAWRQDEITLFGGTVPLPRLTAWHGDPGCDYTYSGIRMQPRPWTAPLLEIKDRIESCSDGARFDCVLLNLYRDGADGMGWHSDDEPELGPDPVVGSVSLGATRAFQLRHRSRRDLDRVDIDLEHGSYLLMAGGTQHHWKHRVPKRTGRRPVGPRINLTFRRIGSPQGHRSVGSGTIGGEP